MQRTIEEIKVDLYSYFLSFSNDDAANSMFLTNELIETVATLQREKCAEEAKLSIQYGTNEPYVEDNVWAMNLGEVTVNKESILNAKL